MNKFLIGESMYFDNRIDSMVKRREDLEKKLMQLDRKAIREEQAFWKDISLLAKELRYKLERYSKKGGRGISLMKRVYLPWL